MAHRPDKLNALGTDTPVEIAEADLGIPLTWGGIPRLVREIGPAMTRDLVMTCRTFGADEALVMGLINRVVPDADLDHAIDTLAAGLTAKAPSALQAAKRQV